ncbi:hypothetical protein [Mycobacteroides salmoniphilum]|uniref:hypothetical protein n=1 Tax=Mycobacteroides salmoniphilum TaxID=404941 RepID=UPI001F477814|nr:hypothetical protein [Mycobacteroides salmoniphilum]
MSVKVAARFKTARDGPLAAMLGSLAKVAGRGRPGKGWCVMGIDPKLAFDPIELDDHATKIERAAAELTEKHSAAHAGISQAIPGLGSGLAAAALGEQLSVWESETPRLAGNLSAHAQYHRSSKNTLLKQEDANRAGIAGVDGQAG